MQSGFSTQLVEIEVRGSRWVKAHQPTGLTRGDQTNRSRRGYDVALTFSEPVTGPLAVGHSSHFGLGLFGPKASNR